MTEITFSHDVGEFQTGDVLRVTPGTRWSDHGYHSIVSVDSGTTMTVKAIGFWLGWWWRFVTWLEGE